MEIELNNTKYELIKDYKEAFDKEEFLEKCTDYFYDYDYVVGDIAYGKLRLKGFYDEKSKKVNKINNTIRVLEEQKKVIEYIQRYSIPVKSEENNKTFKDQIKQIRKEKGI